MTTTAPSWTIDLPWPRPPLDLNKRMHWGQVHRIRNEILPAMHILALQAKLPKGLERVRIVLHWQPRVARKRDSDNPSSTLKACIDGLTRYGLTEDDDSAHVESACVIEPLGPKSRLWLTITEVQS
jgi:crossover junction endodeoxyribonuclease RusA